MNPRDASGMPITQSVGAIIRMEAGTQAQANLIRHTTAAGLPNFFIDPISGACSWDPTADEIKAMPVGGTKMPYLMQALFSDGSAAVFLFGNLNRAL